MKTIPLKPLAAQTASATGDTFFINEPYEEALFVLNVTALATDVGDTLDVFIDVSPDGLTWFNSTHFTQVLGNGSAAKIAAKITTKGDFADPDAVLALTADAAAGVVRQIGLMPYIRYRSTLVDASTDNASFTYSVTGYLFE